MYIAELRDCCLQSRAAPVWRELCKASPVVSLKFVSVDVRSDATSYDFLHFCNFEASGAGPGAYRVPMAWNVHVLGAGQSQLRM